MDFGASFKKYSGYNAGKKALNGDFKGAMQELDKNDIVGNALGLPHLADDPQKADTSELDTASDNAFGLQKSLGDQRAGYGGQYNQSQRWQQDANANKAIGYLDAAATGAVPSAAEMMGRREADRASSQAMGNAAAFAGRNPARAQRLATRGASDAQAAAASDGSILRAKEMADARGQLVGAIQGQQNVLQGYRGQDITEKGNLLSGELGAMDSGNKLIAAKLDVNQKEAAAKNARDAGILNAGAAAIGSDKTMKTDVHDADLDSLAEALKGFTFEYKNPTAEGAAPGKRIGIMAQDAEKGGPVGRGMVKTMTSGSKGIDLGNAVGAALAMSAEALKRTRRAA